MNISTILQSFFQLFYGLESSLDKQFDKLSIRITWQLTAATFFSADINLHLHAKHPTRIGPCGI